MAHVMDPDGERLDLAPPKLPRSEDDKGGVGALAEQYANETCFEGGDSHRGFVGFNPWEKQAAKYGFLAGHAAASRASRPPSDAVRAALVDADASLAFVLRQEELSVVGRDAFEDARAKIREPWRVPSRMGAPMGDQFACYCWRPRNHKDAQCRRCNGEGTIGDEYCPVCGGIGAGPECFNEVADLRRRLARALRNQRVFQSKWSKMQINLRETCVHERAELTARRKSNRGRV